MSDIFVFGSNLAGRHGKGAALYARQHYGAIYGNGVGRQGYGPLGSSYAIPTKDANLKTLPLDEIQHYVWEFLDYALNQMSQPVQFILTPIGCGLAGYTPKEILPLFRSWEVTGWLPDNIILPKEFIEELQFYD